MTDFLEDLLKQQEDEDDVSFSSRRPHLQMQMTQGQSDAGPVDAEGSDAQEEDVREASFGEQRVSHIGQRSKRSFLLPATSYGEDYTGKRHYGTQNGKELPPSTLLRTGLDLNPELNGRTASDLPLPDKIKRVYSAARLWQVRATPPTGHISATSGYVNTQAHSLSKQEAITPSYAALVDAAFARDARRYDGPLRIL